MDPILVSVASVPRRAQLLRRTVESLRTQCDELRVYLNGYDAVPEFLVDDRITVARSQDHGDRGDAGKFFWSGRDVGAYHFTVDDDLGYPADYCQRLIGRLRRYDHRAAVGVHGAVLRSVVRERYYGDRRVLPCLGDLADDTTVHVLGTGALAYHTRTLQITPSTFRRANMADIWFAIAAKRQRVPLVCIAHRRGWIEDLEDPEPHLCIAAGHARHGHLQAEALRRENPWGRPLPVDGARAGLAKGATDDVEPVAVAPSSVGHQPTFGAVKSARRQSGVRKCR